MLSPSTGSLAAIRRHPVKGFTPEPLTRVELSPGVGFPFDRVWAVENGPCGSDPQAPAFVPKQKFAVLASLPRVAGASTRYDEQTGLFHASAEGRTPFAGRSGRSRWSATPPCSPTRDAPMTSTRVTSSSG